MMDNKVELKLSSMLYTKLLEACRKENLNLEEYIIKTLENKEKDIDQVKFLKQSVIKDLQQLITKLQKIENSYEKKSNLTIVLLEDYDSNLPDSLKTEINNYKKKNCFNEKHFYLILDNKTIIGYIGIDLHEEPMPYGQYAFIYCLNILKPYSTLVNLHKVLTFLQKILKNQGIYNMDIASSSSILTEELLIKLGFTKFYYTRQAKVSMIKNTKCDKVFQYTEELIELNINTLNNFVSVDRNLPSRYLLDYWHDHSKELQCKKITVNYNSTLKKLVLISRKTEKNSAMLYWILMEPLDLFDEDIIIQMYTILIKEISLNILIDTFILPIPEEIEALLKQYVNIISSIKNTWYRKMIS